MQIIKVYDESIANIIVVFAYICDICNYRCSYCYNHQPRTNTILDLNSLEQFIQLMNQLTHKQIQLSFIGGEPTLHPDLLNFCKKTIANVIVYSNFSADISLYNNLLENNVNLSLSWHSENKNFLDKLKYLNNFGNIDVTIMVEPKNFDLSLKTFKDARQQFKNSVDLCQIFLNNKEQVYSTKQIKQIEECFSNATTEKNIVCQLSDNTKMYLSQTELIQKDLNSFKHWRCNAGQDCFFVDVNGNIFPCQNSNTVLGNIKTNAIYPKKILCKAEKCLCEIGIYKERIFK